MLAAVLGVAALLALSASPAAADQLLETISVDTGNTTATTGTVALKQGTKYTLQVSGTFTLANGYGQVYDEDALFCYGDQGFDTPQCSPPTTMGDFYIGSGNSALNHIDAYQQPSGGGAPPAYSANHTYTVDFYAPADGVLKAGGLNVYTQCKASPTPCTTTLTGTVTVQIYGPPTGGGPAPGGGGGSSGWVIGGGAELQPPPVFCAVQRGFVQSTFAPASGAQAGSAAPPMPCVPRRPLSQDEKADARGQARAALILILSWCGFAAASKSEQVILKVLHARVLCQAAVAVFAESAALLHDPPDRLFAAPPGRAIQRALAVPAASPCPAALTVARCAALTNAARRYRTVLRLVAAVSADIAIGANRAGAALNGGSAFWAAFQQAFAKINAGALAKDAAALAFYGKALARILRSGRLDATVRASQAKRALSAHPPNGLSKAQLKTIITQLPARSTTSISAVLKLSPPAGAYARQYRSISLTDLATIVNGLVLNGNLAAATGRRLAAELTTAQAVCGQSGRRIAAIKQLVSDLLAHGGSSGGFLAYGARPLLAARIPASSCR